MSVVALLAITLSACGSSSTKDQVSHAWSELKSALVAGDAGQLCDLLSDQARAQLLEAVSTISPSSTCEAAAKTVFNVARDARAQIAKAKLTSVSVHGDQATTTDSTGPPPNSWIKVQGKWQLESFDTGS